MFGFQKCLSQLRFSLAYLFSNVWRVLTILWLVVATTMIVRGESVSYSLFYPTLLVPILYCYWLIYLIAFRDDEKSDEDGDDDDEDDNEPDDDLSEEIQDSWVDDSDGSMVDGYFEEQHTHRNELMRV